MKIQGRQLPKITSKTVFFRHSEPFYSENPKNIPKKPNQKRHGKIQLYDITNNLMQNQLQAQHVHKDVIEIIRL